MSENQNRGSIDFGKYDSMATQELEEILRLDAETPEGQESDTDKILYIMEVLAERKRDNSHTGNTTLEAWESFEKHYLPVEEDSVEYTAKTKKAVRPWVRRLTAVAAAIVLVIGLSATAVNAFGWQDIWNAVAKWAKETFSFVSGDTEVTEPEESFAQEYASLQDAIGETGQRIDMIPTQIPEGYVLQEIIVDENPIQSVYAARYKNDEKVLKITVRSYLGDDPEKVEIDDTLLEIYEACGTKFYIFKNDTEFRATWIKDSYECYISGELTVDTIKTMINSIGKG